MIANGRNVLKFLFDWLKRLLVGVGGVDFGENAKEEAEALVQGRLVGDLFANLSPNSHQMPDG